MSVDNNLSPVSVVFVYSKLSIWGLSILRESWDGL